LAQCNVIELICLTKDGHVSSAATTNKKIKPGLRILIAASSWSLLALLGQIQVALALVYDDLITAARFDYISARSGSIWTK